MGNISDTAYQEVEWIEGTGAQYIDVPQSTSGITRIEATAKFLPKSSSALIGTGVSTSSSYVGIRFFISSSTLYCGINTGRTQLSYTPTGEFVDIAANKTSLKVGSTSFTISYSGSSTCSGFSLFNDHNFTGAATFIKRLKLYKESTLAYDFIPCYRKSDKVIGMYETVAKKFYSNAGTGTFIKGDDITAGMVTYKTVIHNAIKGFNDIQDSLAALSRLEIAKVSGTSNPASLGEIVSGISNCATIKKDDGSFVSGDIPVYDPSVDK